MIECGNNFFLKHDIIIVHLTAHKIIKKNHFHRKIHHTPGVE